MWIDCLRSFVCSTEGWAGPQHGIDFRHLYFIVFFFHISVKLNIYVEMHISYLCRLVCNLSLLNASAKRHFKMLQTVFSVTLCSYYSEFVQHSSFTRILGYQVFMELLTNCCCRFLCLTVWHEWSRLLAYKLSCWAFCFCFHDLTYSGLAVMSILRIQSILAQSNHSGTHAPDIRELGVQLHKILKSAQCTGRWN